MIEFIFNKTSRILREHPQLFASEHEQKLLNKMTLDKNNYSFINFYALNAEEQINNKLATIEVYLSDISRVLKKLKENSVPNTELIELINEFSGIIASLENKKDKIIRLKAIIPEGMLDIKRVLHAIDVDQAILSNSIVDDSMLKHLFLVLKDFMKHANKDYNKIIKQGGSLDFILFETSKLYWMKLEDYRKNLKHVMAYLKQCATLTNSGDLVLRCCQNALAKIPATASALNFLGKWNLKQTTFDSLINQIGFSSTTGQKIGRYLITSGKPFFHMPHNENRYHIDYEPTLDLAETGGNCVGESMMFIQDLSVGRFKRLCPEAGIVNFQLDQTKKLSFQKTVLGQAETDVSAVSKHQSLQWEDAKEILIDNPDFKEGDLCGIFFSMNEYTRAQRTFTPGHIAVVAKLDTSKSLYKYVVFEKEIGVFGLVDDESLEYIINKQIMNIYRGMNYSKMELTKYQEASPATYQFISLIQPVTEDAPKITRERIVKKSQRFSLFEVVRPQPRNDKIPEHYSQNCW